jgi:hypothetical protein
MSSIKRFALPLAAACITMVAFLAGTTSAYALSLQGITPSGTPVFINSVKVRLNKNGGLRAFSNGQGKTFSFFDGSSLRTGFGLFDLRTTVDSSGNISGGTVSIKGKGDDFGLPDSGDMVTLMTADLVSANLTENGSLWGFNTENIFCAVELGVSCTNKESVYLVLNSAFGGSFTDKFTASGTAHTTVPVPAAAWLFGSALGLLGWVRRRANATA